MRYPDLVRDSMCKTFAKVSINKSDAYDEDGEPVEGYVYSGRCNYQEKAHTIITADKRKVEVTGKCLFNGDILPDVNTLDGGMVNILGRDRKIEYSFKARNPDGTVNFTQLEIK